MARTDGRVCDGGDMGKCIKQNVQSEFEDLLDIVIFALVTGRVWILAVAHAN